MDSVFDKVGRHKKQNLPFVLYRKPNSKTVVGIFQENDHLYFSKNFQEKGFVFAPFHHDNVIVFPLEFSEVKFAAPHFVTSSEDSFNEVVENETEKENFISLVQKGIDAINTGVFNKVVLSRTENVAIPNFDLEVIFERMLQQYPTAFCYCWFHPKIGMWMGATPERLLQAKENKFNTMALAGTQQFLGNDVVFWQNKEREEQEFVTHFIIDNLKNIASEVNVSSPYTTRAGNILHLKTDIEGVLDADSNLKKVVDILHPTPAVCGVPKILAKDFILENEGYEREYYTGFLGEINHDFSTNEIASDLYVNLRCMKIKKQEAQLFMGCGITKSSNPDAEWEETVNKSKTMKRIL
ncbi:isochorismate synthase [Flavobacterium sp.]|uniref:isochorismate synthase n=1 Tax=Flavobacterium sp. TaxID=239 RepID=UPI00260F0753|nr:isochorismate synthase [Flavobacterium sp.]